MEGFQVFVFINLISYTNHKLDKKSNLKQIIRPFYGESSLIYPQKNYIISSSRSYNDKLNVQDVIQRRYTGLRNKIRRLKYQVFRNTEENMAFYRKHKKDYLDDNYLLRLYKINKILDLEEYINYNQDFYKKQTQNYDGNTTYILNRTNLQAQRNNITIPLSNISLSINASRVIENNLTSKSNTSLTGIDVSYNINGSHLIK